MIVRALVILLILGVAPNAFAQQVPDRDFRPPIENPAFGEGTGPLVLIDEAHHNYHTVDGRYTTFANLLRRDGYVVEGSAVPFTEEALRDAKILVIANALNEANVQSWSNPVHPAFTDAEVAAVRAWVEAGGALFLIADHMPFPAAAQSLGAAFGMEFSNGYARNGSGQGGITFSRADGSLLAHPIIEGRDPSERVNSVRTFGGQAMRAEPGVAVEPLMLFDEGSVSILTETSGQFSDDLPRQPVAGWFQGVVLRHGGGRVAISGEAAMFSAQLSGPNQDPMGMNHPEAAENPQFLLNVVHWLSGLLDG